MNSTTTAWDRLDNDTFWQPLPPSTLSQALSGETPSVFLRRDSDGWWVDRADQAGMDGPHVDFDAVCRAGNKVLEEAWDAVAVKITEDCGLSPDEWTCVYEDGVHFRSQWDGAISISAEADGTANVWRYDQDHLGAYPTVREAAEAYAAVPAPGL